MKRKNQYLIVPSIDGTTDAQVFIVQSAPKNIKKRILAALKSAKIREMGEDSTQMVGTGFTFEMSNHHTPSGLIAKRLK